VLNLTKNFVLVAMLFALSPLAAAQDSVADRQAAVERYYQAMPFEAMMVEMSEEMAKQLPENQRADFVKFMTSEIRFDVVLVAAKASLAKHLTTEEINAFTEFMSSPVGKSATAKMKYYMADIMPVVQAEVARAIEARKAASPKS